MAANPFESFVQIELPKRPYLETDAPQQSVLIRAGAGPRQMRHVVLAEGEVLGMVDGELKGLIPNTGPEIDAAVHIQAYTSTRWVIEHNRNNRNVQISLYDAEGREFEADRVQIGDNAVTVFLVEPAMGRAVLLFAPGDEVGYSFEPDESIGDISALEFEPEFTINGNVSELGRKGNNDLLASFGYANGGMRVAFNNHLESALGVRIHGTPAAVLSSEESLYRIELGQDKQWSVVQSVLLANQAFGSVITNFYDVELEIVDLLNAGESAKVTLIRYGNTYRAQTADGEAPMIFDGTFTSNLGVYQDIRNVDYFAAAFPSAQRNAVGSPLGDFEVTLTCTPKAGVVASVVTNTIRVIVTAEPE